MKPVARLVFREQGQTSVHTKTYGDVSLMRVDLQQIFDGEGWILLREGESGDHSYDEWLRVRSIVFYRSEVFNV